MQANIFDNRPTDDQRHGALICLRDTFHLIAETDGPAAAYDLLVRVAKMSALLDTTDVAAVRDEYEADNR